MKWFFWAGIFSKCLVFICCFRVCHMKNYKLKNFPWKTKKLAQKCQNLYFSKLILSYFVLFCLKLLYFDQILYGFVTFMEKRKKILKKMFLISENTFKIIILCFPKAIHFKALKVLFFDNFLAFFMMKTSCKCLKTNFFASK